MITLQARETLADCAVAIEDFETSAATKYWRTRWVAVVTLLRSVGYVLEKVDAPSDPTVGAAISAEFQDLKRSKPEPHIYWEFIDKERHSVVKEMEFGAHLNITVRPGTAWWNPKTGETGGLPSGETTYDHFMVGSVFEGRDPRELCHQAMAFWNNHLKQVERRIAEALAPAAV